MLGRQVIIPTQVDINFNFLDQDKTYIVNLKCIILLNCSTNQTVVLLILTKHNLSNHNKLNILKLLNDRRFCIRNIDKILGFAS